MKVLLSRYRYSCLIVGFCLSSVFCAHGYLTGSLIPYRRWSPPPSDYAWEKYPVDVPSDPRIIPAFSGRREIQKYGRVWLALANAPHSKNSDDGYTIAGHRLRYAFDPKNQFGAPAATYNHIAHKMVEDILSDPDVYVNLVLPDDSHRLYMIRDSQRREIWFEGQTKFSGFYHQLKKRPRCDCHPPKTPKAPKPKTNFQNVMPTPAPERQPDFQAASLPA